MAEKDNAPDQGKTKKSPMMLILVGVILLLLIGGGVAGFLFMNRDKPDTSKAGPADATSTAVASGEFGGLVGPMVDIEPFIVNILDQNGTRYLKASITLEVLDEKKIQTVQTRMPQVRDAILLLVGNKTFNELSDLQGKLQLRSELLDRLNQILGKNSVRKIYFTDFVVQ